MGLISSRAIPAMPQHIRMLSIRNLIHSEVLLLFSVGLGPNQVCTLFGASPGSTAVPGKDYLKAGYSLNTADLWRRHYLVLVVFFVFFCFTQTAVIEIFPVSIVKLVFGMSLIMSLSG